MSNHTTTRSTKSMASAAMLAAVFAVGATSTAPVMASAPMAKFVAPGFFRLMIGDFEVTALSDGTVDLPMDKLIQQPPARTNAALAHVFLKSPMETSINAYLINTGSKLVLIDTGAGALFGPTLGKLLANLQAAGYRPDQVDEVLLTHMHPDHEGGLVKDGKAAFPNAIVRGDQRDADYWLSQANADKAPADAKGFFQGAIGSLQPYVAAHTYQPFKGGTQLLPGISAVQGYGHTPGHIAYQVESKGQKLLVIGDLIHVSAVQLDHPEVTIAFDTDGKAAVQSRERLFTEAANNGELVAASHMPFPGIGHLRADGKKYQWIPVNYTQMR
jgi:glyoxylase-like metal-dependent hydrolase (beta-lactamase superfamily II)